MPQKENKSKKYSKSKMNDYIKDYQKDYVKDYPKQWEEKKKKPEWLLKAELEAEKREGKKVQEAQYAGLENGEAFSVTGSVSWSFNDINVGKSLQNSYKSFKSIFVPFLYSIK